MCFFSDIPLGVSTHTPLTPLKGGMNVLPFCFESAFEEIFNWLAL